MQGAEAERQIATVLAAAVMGEREAMGESDAGVDALTSEQTARLAEWALVTRFDDLPQSVIRTSKSLILDFFGVAIAGSRHDAALAGLNLVRELGGDPRATVLGTGYRTSMVNAALVNGISAHILDFDDTHIPTVLHPTAPIMSAGLAVCEARGRSGPDLIRAHAMAVELSSRVSLAIYPEHYDAGWHMSGTTGTIGAAAAAALLEDVNHRQFVQVLGIAATQASGHREQFGAMTKALHVGKAASNGILASLLGARGFTAAPDSLQGRRGMFAVMSPSSRPNALVAGIGKDWEIARVGIKPYACGVVTHAPMDALRRLRTERGVQPDQVETIELRVNPLVTELTGKREPRTGLEGKFSVTFCAAIAMIDGVAGPQQFTDSAVQRPEVVALRDRIHIVPDGGIGHSQAIAIAYLKDGSAIMIEVTAASGTPENPLSDEERHEKFVALTEPVLGTQGATRVKALVESLDALTSVDALIAAAIR